MKTLFTLLLLILTVVGSLGIPLYKHTCFHENTTIRTVLIPSDHCTVTHQEVRKTQECCKKPTVLEKHNSVDSKCCNEEVDQLQLPLTFFESSPFFTSVFLVPCKPKIIGIKARSHYENFSIQLATNSDPPPLTVLERLPLICIWRL